MGGLMMDVDPNENLLNGVHKKKHEIISNYTNNQIYNYI